MSEKKPSSLAIITAQTLRPTAPANIASCAASPELTTTSQASRGTAMRSS